MAWLSSWNNRIKFIVSCEHVDNTLTDFPFLLNISSASGKNTEDITEIFDELTSTSQRKKIAVTDYTGTDQCYVEIERWAQEERSAQLWVKAPIINNNVDSVFYLYYDTTQSGNIAFVGDTGSTPAQTVWDSNFVAVYHMAQDPSTGTDAIKDSTVSNYHLSTYGNMTSGDLVDGTFSKAIQLDAIDDYMLGPQAINNTMCSSQFTFEILAKDIGRLFHSDDIASDSAGNTDRVMLGGWQYQINDAESYSVSPSVWSGGTWHYGIFRRLSDTSADLYRDGVYFDTTTPVEATTISPLDPIFFAIRNPAVMQWTPGTVEEMRISNVARSVNWIKATNYSNKDELIIYEKEVTASWLETYEQGSLSPWTKRVKISIDNTKVDNTLVDFPVLINISNSSGYNNRDISSVLTELTVSGTSYTERKKIAITDSDGLTQLPVEIENWDHGNSSIQLWTKLPTVGYGEATDLYLYYDKTKSDNTDYIGDTGETPARNVWDDNFVAVYHMAQDPSGGSLLDSTYNNITGTMNGTLTLVNDIYGSALNFNGVDSYIDFGTQVLFDIDTPLTLEASIKRDNTDSYYIFNGNNSAESATKHNFVGNDEYIQFDEYPPSGGDLRRSSNVVTAGTWHDITATTNSLITNIYVDGLFDDSGTTETYTGGAITNWLIGTRLWPSVPAYYFEGLIGEFRYSKIDRSSYWLKATNYSNKDTLNFYSTEETYTASVITPYYYHGYIKETGLPVSRKVFLYNRTTGDLIDSDESRLSDGYYIVQTFDNIQHFIVVLDDDAGEDYNPIARDRLLPNG